MTVPRNAYELRRRIAADMAELARIEGKAPRIACPHILAMVERVAAETGVPASAIMSDTRRGPEAAARQRVYLLAHEAGYSTPYIGRVMGRDHSSVIHGIKAAKARVTQ